MYAPLHRDLSCVRRWLNPWNGQPPVADLSEEAGGGGWTDDDVQTPGPELKCSPCPSRPACPTAQTVPGEHLRVFSILFPVVGCHNRSLLVDIVFLILLSCLRSSRRPQGVVCSLEYTD